MESFHIKVFDMLHQDLRRMLIKTPPQNSQIKRFNFYINSYQMDTFLKGMEAENKRSYVSAKFDNNGVIHKVDIRIKGQKHWHILGRKKSLKVKLPKGTLIDNNQEFELININTPLVIGEKIILDMAKESGLLTVESDFARLNINGMDMGVFQYNASLDESLFRKNKRFPGSIYVSNLSEAEKSEILWNNAIKWKKITWYDAKAKNDITDLKRLLQKIKLANMEEFADFAKNEMDIERFAALDALDIIFGSDSHAFKGDHILYFDPYKGKWEPIASNFDGFKHEPKLNFVENPILSRLKLLPQYIYLRNSYLNKMLKSLCSPSSIRNRGMKILSKLMPELSTDPYWESYKLLPKVNEFYRLMLRPMNMERLKLVFEYEMATFAKRYSYLLNELPKNSPSNLVNYLNKPEIIHIGPGEVEVLQTLIFNETKSVEVLPGTTLLMGKNASLIFLGKASFKGNKNKPIIIKPKDSSNWGGLVFQGNSSRNSSLEYVNATYGTVPRWRLIHYPGMINFHDTANIIIHNCNFGLNHVSDDVVHIVYVKNFIAKDCVIKHTNSDAWDIEFSNGLFKRIRVNAAGDDGLDLMEADIKLTDSIILACKGNGISAGQESKVLVRDTFISNSRVGILVKSGSFVNISGNLLYKNSIGLHCQRVVLYPKKNKVRANVLFIVNCIEAIKKDENSESPIDINLIKSHLKNAKILNHLLKDILCLNNWNELDSLLKEDTGKEAI